ncbi:MAG: hypothetical protein Ct9H90mP10_06260 [Actinomycetota bacterium]|nr:MAG: hypothetical protein Ct9H90mP10_06260 [Actinomycetota bacterium]
MNKLQTQFDVSSLLLSDNSIHFDVHGFLMSNMLEMKP